jgi:hypothetical protein
MEVITSVSMATVLGSDGWGEKVLPIIQGDAKDVTR